MWIAVRHQRGTSPSWRASDDPADRCRTDTAVASLQGAASVAQSDQRRPGGPGSDDLRRVKPAPERGETSPEPQVQEEPTRPGAAGSAAARYRWSLPRARSATRRSKRIPGTRGGLGTSGRAPWPSRNRSSAPARTRPVPARGTQPADATVTAPFPPEVACFRHDADSAIKDRVEPIGPKRPNAWTTGGHPLPVDDGITFVLRAAIGVSGAARLRGCGARNPATIPVARHSGPRIRNVTLPRLIHSCA